MCFWLWLYVPWRMRLCVCVCVLLYDVSATPLSAKSKVFIELDLRLLFVANYR